MKRLIALPLLLLSLCSFADEFRIDYGITGSWYNPDLPGQGFSLEVVPHTKQFVAYWFTFQVESGEQRWLLGQGTYEDNIAVTNVIEPVGGTFVQSEGITAEQWGSAVFRFSSCANGTVEFASENNGSDTFNIVRITDNVACQGGSK